MSLSQEQDSELAKKQSSSFTSNQPNDAAARAPVRSGPPRSGPPRGRGGSSRTQRPSGSEGQSYYNSGAGSGRLQPEEPRSMRSPPYSARNRQRLSSSEQMPLEVRHLFIR